MKLSEKLINSDIIKDHLTRALNLAESSANMSYFYDMLDAAISTKTGITYRDKRILKDGDNEFIVETFPNGEVQVAIRYQKTFWSNLFGISRKIKLSDRQKHQLLHFLNT